MPDMYFWSDQHAFHANIISFTRMDGETRLRPEFWSDDGTPKGFRDIFYMNKWMAERFNDTAKDGDIVYFGGDLCAHEHNAKSFMQLLRRRTTNYLCLGNHDDIRLEWYQNHFADIRAEYDFAKEYGFILTHYPLHTSQVGKQRDAEGRPRGGIVNVHGHTHARKITLLGRTWDDTVPLLFGDDWDPRYFNICVENHDYGLVPLNTILEAVARRRAWDQTQQGACVGAK